MNSTPMASVSQADVRTDKVIRFYEQLSPGSLAHLPDIYAWNARFEDPFNKVEGIMHIAMVFEHMFATLAKPRFQVLHAVTRDQHAWLTWNFIIERGAQEWVIHGATHLVYDEHGRISSHRDYWDPAQQLYERLPVLGPLMRWLRRRLGATPVARG